jgi:hypothetical protein
VRRFHGLAKKYRESKKLQRSAQGRPLAISTTHTRQASLQLELLESRCMLAGNFLRLDGIPPGGIPTSDDLSVAQATEAHASYYNHHTGVLIRDDDPAPFGGPFWTIQTDEILAWSGGISNASVGNADANATAQALSQVVTGIGNTTPAPTVNLVAAQLGHATASSDSYPNNYSSWGEARAEATLYTRFQYQALPGEENIPVLFNGFIHAAAGGVVSSHGNGSAAMNTLLTPPLSIWQQPIQYNGIRVWLEGNPPILLAEVYFSGAGLSHEGSPPATTGQWAIWGLVRDQNGQLQDFSQTGSGAQVLIPFFAQITHGAVIVFDADPNRSPAGVSDVGGIGGVAYVGYGEESYEEDFAQANVFQTISAWGFAGDNLNPPPDVDPIFDDGEGGPGDLNGDGVNDGQDAGLWAQILADYAARGLMPLIVTTEDDIANGNYSYGDLSLREAIALAATPAYAGPDTIVFAPWVEEVDLINQLLIISGNDVSIVGPGADKLTIDGPSSANAFIVGPSTSVTLRGMRITGGGGGVHSSGGTLTIDQCQIDNNVGNGGVRHGGGTLLITNSTVANNTANSPKTGGGVYVTSAISATIRNSTISTNSAVMGGGIWVNGSNLRVINSTVTNNTSTSGKVGIETGGTNVLVRLDNTIVAGNYQNGVPADLSSASGVINSASSYNLIGFDPSLTNGLNNGTSGNQVGGEETDPAINPMLGALANNGGPILTHALLIGSPAIDKGDPNFDPDAFSPPMLYDGRAGGFSRIVNGDAIVGARLDIGSYEYQPPQSASSAAAIDASLADYDLTPKDRMTLAALGIEEELPQKRRSLRPRVRGLLI